MNAAPARRKDRLELLTDEEIATLSSLEAIELVKEREADAEEREAIVAENIREVRASLIAKPSPETMARVLAAEAMRIGADGWRSEVERHLAATAPIPADGFTIADLDTIFASLPPVPWLVERLDICPGAPTLIAGYGYSGKTVAAQSLALTIAGGGRIWGDISPSRRGRVVHLDYEQGGRLTFSRYQRIAAAMGLRLEDLVGLLGVAVLPSLHLDAPGASGALARTCEGAALCIVDSLRAAAPTLDENSSEVRRVLDMLTTISEKTGCVFLVISHSRKPKDDATGGARMAIRGSSAIYDACSSVLVFSAAKGEPIRVEHEKARTTGTTADDFALTISDVEIAGNPKGGLEVAIAGLPPKSEMQAAHAAARRSAVDSAVLDFVARNPGCNARAVRGNVDGKSHMKDDALERLKASRAIVERPGNRGARTFWIGEAQ